jgi:hypothetical protein
VKIFLHSLIRNGKPLKKTGFMQLRLKLSKNGRRIRLHSATNIRTLIKRLSTTFKTRLSTRIRKRSSTVRQILAYTRVLRPFLAQKDFIRLSKSN